MTIRRRSDPGRAYATLRKSQPAADDDNNFEETREAQPASKSSKEHEAIPAGLYLVATPIGNAADISLRALRVLASVDAIACEDTRITAKLLAIHNISRPLVRYDEHTARAVGPALLQRIGRGERIALVSDAGTPLISDPGQRLVSACIEAGLAVSAIPGASAVITALTLSGLPSGRFLFAGFLAERMVARRRELGELAAVAATLVVLESPRRLAASLADMADVLGPREAAVARELTKRFEEVRRGPLDDLAAHYRAAGPPKGEVTVVIGPPPAQPPVGEAEADRLLTDALARLSPRDAAAAVAQATGLPRRLLYARANALREARR